MRYWLILFLLISFNVQAKPLNEKYSYKDFTGKSFRDISVEEFNNTIIVGSCFYQEWDWDRPETSVVKDIFPDGLKDITFENCNLDNVRILDKCENCTFIKNTMKTIKVQNDWDDWILDNALKPIEPLNKQDRLKVGVSVDPKDIPSEKSTEEERNVFQNSLNSISP